MSNDFKFWKWSWEYGPTAEEKRNRALLHHESEMRRLEREATQALIDKSRAETQAQYAAIQRQQVDTMLVYQDMERQRMEMELRRIEHARSMEMLYPNDMGAYPVYLNPDPTWNPLLLPPANSKYQPPEPTPAPVKSFSELMQDGTLNQALAQNKIILGYQQGELRFGSWLDLYSCGIGGVSGSGKTTTARFLLFQAMLAGSQFIMIDPHIGDEDESLAAEFRAFPAVHRFEPCGDIPTLVMERIHFLRNELDKRKLRGIKSPSIVLIIDEFNAVMRVEKVRNAIANLLVAIAQEGRKFGLYAMLLGQRWSSQDIGGADIRGSLASTLSHRFTDRDQAVKLIGETRTATKCLSLPKGHYFFRDTDGNMVEMATPLTVSEDGQEIMKMLRGYETSSPYVVESSIETEPLKPVRNQFETSFETSSNPRLEAIGTRIMQLQAKGVTKPEIVKQIWRVTPGPGKDYEQANEEYKRAMQIMCAKLGMEIEA